MSQGLPLYWRLIPQRYNLIGSICKSCDERYFPRRELCPKCRRKGKIEEIKFCGEGKIYSHTTIYAPPDGFEDQRPYVLAIIKLKEGPKVTAQVVDCKSKDVKIGKRVKLVFRKITSHGSKGIIKYGYKFKLV